MADTFFEKMYLTADKLGAENRGQIAENNAALKRRFHDALAAQDWPDDDNERYNKIKLIAINLILPPTPSERHRAAYDELVRRLAELE
jgi:hypothetical protein